MWSVCEESLWDRVLHLLSLVKRLKLPVNGSAWFVDSMIPYLKWLNKCVEENSDRDASPEKLDESRSSEQLEEADLDELCDVDNTSNHSDKVKGVPGVFEIVLENIMLD